MPGLDTALRTARTENATLVDSGAEVANRNPADPLNSGIGSSLLNLIPSEFAELVRVER
jgi:hypothetical protein